MGVVIKLYSGEIKNSKHSQFSSEWSKAPESTPNFAVTSNLHGTSINDHLIPNYIPFRVISRLSTIIVSSQKGDIIRK